MLLATGSISTTAGGGWAWGCGPEEPLHHFCYNVTETVQQTQAPGPAPGTPRPRDAPAPCPAPWDVRRLQPTPPASSPPPRTSAGPPRAPAPSLALGEPPSSGVMRLARFAQQLRADYLESLGLSFQPVLMAMAPHRESCSMGRGPRNAPG